MRILLADRTAHRGRRPGLLSTLASGLEARGHQCELLLTYGSSAGILPPGRTAWWLPPVAWWAARRARGILRRLRPDVVSAYNPTVAAHVLPACVAEGIPLVVTVLNMTSLGRCAAAVSYACAIVAFNRTTAEHIAGQRPDVAGKVVLLDKPIDLEVFRPPPQVSAAPFRVVCLGRLSHTKGQRVLTVLEACAGLVERIPDLEVEVVGGGSLLGEVRARAAEINRAAGRRVAWAVGDTVRPQDRLQRAEVAVGAGFSAAEGLACGCQVIGLGFAGLFGLVGEETVEEALDANFGDCAARRPEVTAELIAGELLAAYGLRDAPREWARRVVETRLAAPVAVGRLEEVLREAAQSRRLTPDDS